MNKASVRQNRFNDPVSFLYGIDLITRSFWDDAYDRISTDYKFTANALEMILFIARNPKCRQDDITKKLRIDKGCVTKTMYALEQHEYIHRTRSEEDRRAYELTLLPAGKKTADKLNRFADEWIRNKAGKADMSDPETLIHVMEALMSDH